MNFSVFGLGYVGTVTAACLADRGYHTVGVDTSEDKVRAVNNGRSPVQEDRVSDLVKKTTRKGTLEATLNADEAVHSSDGAFICVGTPSKPNGELTTTHIEKVSYQIGKALQERLPREDPFLVVVRSTILPGTMRSLVIPTLEEAAGYPVGEGYEVVFHPEFLREGSSVQDFYHPPKIVIGERKPEGGEALVRFYKDFEAPLFQTSLEVAESVKYADNLFHAVKVTFANEIGQFFLDLGVDHQQVMDIFCQDTKLNISSKYLRPGFAFGGSCLPKDLRAVLSASQDRGLELPMLKNVLPSNELQIKRVYRQIISSGWRRIGLYGVAFKPGTDDVRESPYLKLAALLFNEQEVQLHCYDPLVDITEISGKNRQFMKKTLPALPKLLVDSVESLSECQCIVMGHSASVEKIKKWIKNGAVVLDITTKESKKIESNKYKKLT